MSSAHSSFMFWSRFLLSLLAVFENSGLGTPGAFFWERKSVLAGTHIKQVQTVLVCIPLGNLLNTWIISWKYWESVSQRSVVGREEGFFPNLQVRILLHDPHSPPGRKCCTSSKLGIKLVLIVILFPTERGLLSFPFRLHNKQQRILHSSCVFAVVGMFSFFFLTMCPNKCTFKAFFIALYRSVCYCFNIWNNCDSLVFERIRLVWCLN